MTDPTRPIAHDKMVPDLMKHFADAHLMMAALGLDPKLTHLIELRASQINQCAFCVKMHSGEARRDGETNERLDRLVVWRHVSDFTAKEKAVFAWTEALTVLDPKTDYGELRRDLREHLSDQEISLVTTAVGLINLWNRMQVSTH